MRKIIRLFLIAAAASLLLANNNIDYDANLKAMREQAKASGWTFSVDDKALRDYGGKMPTGLKIPENWQSLAPFNEGRKYAEEKLPVRWDWRERGGVTEVKNQKNCGSCWAFGTVAAFESAIYIATGKQLNLSEQQLVSCSPSYGTCGGGYFAFGFYLQKGANYTEDFPYAAQNVSCKSSAPQNEKLVEWYYVGGSNREPTIEELKSAIYNYGVVAVTIAASGAIGNYSGGVFNACNRNRTDHIVALVGWDDEDETWIVKNSWGTKWGEGGYARMKWNDESGKKCNRVGENAAYGIYNPKK